MAMMREESEADEELVARAVGGDREAFGALIERHYAFVHRLAYRCCGRKAEAEDIAQDVCIRLGKAIRSYRGAGAFTTWLYTVTLNAARDHGRKSARDAARVKAYGLHVLVTAAGESEADDPIESLWEAIRQLPDKQREAMTLVYGEGVSHAVAAEVLGVSETTVSWHIHEAKKRLKVLMHPAGAV